MERKRGWNLEHQDVVVDKEGDVILVLKTADVEVSSSHLAKASPVFKVIFEHYSIEGFQNSAIPGRLILPDDDTRAMIDLCKAAHEEGRDSDEEDFDYQKWGEPEFTFTITKLADKYRCLSLISEYMRSRLPDFFQDIKVEDSCACYLLPAIKLEMLELATQVLRAMVWHSTSAIAICSSNSTHQTKLHHFRGNTTPEFDIDNELARVLPDGWSEALCRITIRTKISLAAWMSAAFQRHCDAKTFKCDAGHTWTHESSTYARLFVSRLDRNTIQGSLPLCDDYKGDCINCAELYDWQGEVLAEIIQKTQLPEFCAKCIMKGRIHDVLDPCEEK